MSATTNSPSTLRPQSIKLEDLAITRFVEDGSVVGSPMSFTTRPTVRPIRRMTSDVKRSA